MRRRGPSSQGPIPWSRCRCAQDAEVGAGVMPERVAMKPASPVAWICETFGCAGRERRAAGRRRARSGLLEAPQTKHVDRVPGVPIADQIREDLADDRGELEAVP